MGDRELWVLALCAPPFAGKSTLAAALAEATGAAIVSLDGMNRGRGLELTPGVPFTEWQETYRQTEQAIADGLAGGRSLIVDSTNVRRALRDRWRRAATAQGARFHLAYLDADPALLEERRRENRRTGVRHDLVDKVFHGSLARLEPPSASESPITLDAAGLLSDWVARVLREVAVLDGPAR